MMINYHCCCGESIGVTDDGLQTSTERINLLVDEFRAKHQLCLSKTWEDRTYYRRTDPTIASPIKKEVTG